jgi:pyrroloquinoline quinone (PQQ) biosynthesis protein C
MDTEAFVQQVKDRHEEINYSHHPLWQKMIDGELDKRALGGWVIQQGFLVKAGGDVLLVFASRMRDEQMRKGIIANLTGEIIGIGDVADHWQLAVKMARACGWSDEEIANERPLPETRGLIVTHQALATWAPTVEPILAAATIAGEQTFGDICPPLAKAVTGHYGLTEDEAEYVIEHAEADIEHAEAGWQVVRMAGLTEDRQRLTLKYLEDLAELWWMYCEGVLRYVEGRPRWFTAKYSKAHENGVM